MKPATTAVQHVSMCGLLAIGGVVVERPEKEKAGPAMPGGGGMGDMY